MNREIKFRAWDIKGKRMLTPTLINVKNKTLSAIVEKTNKGNWESVYRFGEVIFMKFTRLNDKNGVGIYEGDVVADNRNEKYEVVFDDMNLCYSGKCLKTLELFQLNKNNVLMVLGNKYSNPELLKQKDGK